MEDMARKRMAELASEETEFRREIGLFSGVSILGGIMIGGGIFYLGSYVLMRTGFSLGLSLLCWVLGGLVSLLGGLCFAELGAMIPRAGGMTVYLNEAFHPLFGFLNGFNSWVLGGPGSLSAGALALTAMFGLKGTGGKVAATLVTLAFTAYNYYGVRIGAWLQNIAMVAKLIPIAIIMGAALASGEAAPVLSMAPMDGPVPIGRLLNMVAFATVATLWAYEGWTYLNTVTEEVKNPRRTLPLALIIAIVGITALYTLFNYAIFKVIPASEIRSLVEGGSLYLGTEAALRLLGSAGGIVVTVGMMISMLGSINGMTLAFPRMYYAMAEEGHFFSSFRKLHPRYRIPHVALLWQCAIVIALIWSRSLDELTSLVVFTGMIYNALAIAAVLVLRRKMPDAERPYRVWGGRFTVSVTILINIALLANTFIEDPVTSVIGLSVPAAGTALYLYFDWKLKKTHKGLSQES